MKTFFRIILGIIIFVAILFVLQILGLKSYQYFAPKYEEVRRDVFFNTASYQLGKEQDERKLEREMERSIDAEDKEILENVFDHVRD